MEYDKTVERVAVYLRREIPKPPPPPVKKQKSFATLSEGQMVKSLKPAVVGGKHLPEGTLWVVLSPTNLGVTLTTAEITPPISMSMTSKDWKSQYERVRRKRNKKK